LPSIHKQGGARRKAKPHKPLRPFAASFWMLVNACIRGVGTAFLTGLLAPF
jgi:hypothetical protein